MKNAYQALHMEYQNILTIFLQTENHGLSGDRSAKIRPTTIASTGYRPSHQPDLYNLSAVLAGIARHHDQLTIAENAERLKASGE